ncbi:hypothetical protein D3C76_1051890 [compost metagenome]
MSSGIFFMYPESINALRRRSVSSGDSLVKNGKLPFSLARPIEVLYAVVAITSNTLSTSILPSTEPYSFSQ